jgi:hypothetical protein
MLKAVENPINESSKTMPEQLRMLHKQEENVA